MDRTLFEPVTFCGCETPYEASRVALFGAPYDGATSFRPGARFAPNAMRTDSWGLETYSPYQDRDLDDMAVADLGDLEMPAGHTELAQKRVERTVGELLDDGRLPVMIGGDHSLTLGAVRALHAVYPNLHIVHLDAHTDLRDDYLGDPRSHACVMRRCHDLLGDGRIHSFGVRSGTREEFAFAHRHLDFHAFTLAPLPAVVDDLGDVPLYVTIDLDVIDPSILPGTGTPEPGGVALADLWHALRAMGTCRIVGTDLMELAPPLDLSGASTAVACKVLREWLLVMA